DHCPVALQQHRRLHPGAQAMATGLPVVSTRVGGIPDVLDEGQTGWLVPPSDEAALRERIAALHGDPTGTRTAGAKARSVAVSRYSGERMQRDYLELYARVLSPKRYDTVRDSVDVRDRRSV
ncbi:MAG TPA: glycosyltransferase, partial [Kofleriaceae bacterium]|nr:glycosyltransferase [Kofleriaceae bacterium]